MRTFPRRTTQVVAAPCPPGCWICAVQVRRPPATPLGVAVVEAVLAHLRWHRDRAAGAGPARSWPLSAWWEETLG
ncbi:hypothetical protein GTQ99_12985 [Kineococcus sp. T13]|uniref:hypothetical protein n=1 Tax=Kineococcus vitellinus TaxID=2696565 RepID=UPI001412F34D|nr:hypothetical protein [Kineococcus vitellinus]NAZ76320.1 hypothetical protein [Kineococcus vitellinus]